MLSDSMNISSTATVSELNIVTAKVLRVDGIEYRSEFTSDGLKIPCVCTSGYGTTEGIKQMAYYLMIPKEELVKMMKEYLPEVLASLYPPREVVDDEIRVIPL